MFLQEIVTLSHPLFFLPGPGSGSMSNAKRWRASLPTSFKSPFHAQADLGYFSLGRKQYGGFFLAVNCFSGHICVFKINNTRMPTLLTAIGKMTKVSDKNYSMLPPSPFINAHPSFFLCRTNIFAMCALYCLTVKSLSTPKKLDNLSCPIIKSNCLQTRVQKEIEPNDTCEVQRLIYFFAAKNCYKPVP